MSKKTHDGLFNNPIINKALESMSGEQIEQYKKIGEELYGTIDFEDNHVLNNMPPPMKDAVIYIEESIKSGQHISTLEDNEKQLLKEAHGEDWYLNFGYTKEDVNDIVTFPKN